MAPLRLVSESFPDDPAFDAAISTAILQRVAAGELPDTLRISRPGPAVVFGKRDVIGAGYPEAVAAARALGFEAVERIAGGRAAVFHEGTVSIAHASREDDPRVAATRRFEEAAELTVRAFARLGVDARVGEVPGEYCPGRHSVNVRGERKLMGVGQRIVRRGVHIGMVVVVSGEDRVRDVLTPVYAALGLDWRPATTGSIADEVGAIDWDGAREAIEAEYSTLHELEQVPLDDETLELARRLAPAHLSPGAR